jgi:hypothetical protein
MLISFKNRDESGMVVDVYNPSSWETEVGG